jgi:hypothetical protein
VYPQSNGDGFATSGSTNSLTDATKNWANTNMWNYHKVRIIAGRGAGQELVLTSSNSTTLTLSQSLTFSPPPDSSSLYSIEDCYGVASQTGIVTTLTDSTQLWPVNYFNGKRVRMAGGVGGIINSTATFPQEGAITSNSTNTLTFGTVTGTGPFINTPYAIMAVPAAGVSDSFIWANNTSDTSTITNGSKYFYRFRGGLLLPLGTIIDRYNLNTSRWDYIYAPPVTEPFGTGSMYSYDGNDRIYMTNNSTGRIYYFDCVQQVLNDYGMVPYGMGAAVGGNRMEVIATDDRVKFLYVMRHSGTEMWRTMLFL